jgi:hypothetical protein
MQKEGSRVPGIHDGRVRGSHRRVVIPTEADKHQKLKPTWIARRENRNLPQGVRGRRQKSLKQQQHSEITTKNKLFDLDLSDTWQSPTISDRDDPRSPQLTEDEKNSFFDILPEGKHNGSTTDADSVMACFCLLKIGHVGQRRQHICPLVCFSASTNIPPSKVLLEGGSEAKENVC